MRPLSQIFHHATNKPPRLVETKILEFLAEGPATRQTMYECLKFGHDDMNRMLGKLLDENKIEIGRVNNAEMFFLKGQ